MVACWRVGGCPFLCRLLPCLASRLPGSWGCSLACLLPAPLTVTLHWTQTATHVKAGLPFDMPRPSRPLSPFLFLPERLAWWLVAGRYPAEPPLRLLRRQGHRLLLVQQFSSLYSPPAVPGRGKGIKLFNRYDLNISRHVDPGPTSPVPGLDSRNRMLRQPRPVLRSGAAVVTTLLRP